MARIIMLKILTKYFLEGSYLNLSLNQELKNEKLSRQDKDLITKIVYGVVQYQLYLEYLLAPLIEGKKVKMRDKVILLMAIYQLEFLDSIPDYAVVSSSVNLAKAKSINAGKFVNAILNSYIAGKKPDVNKEDEDTRISITTSHPLWIVKLFKAQYGLETTKAILESNNQTPPRTARVNTLKTTREDICASNPDFTMGLLAPDALHFKAGNIANTKEYQDGLVTIQDESSQLVARVLDPKKTDRVLDMCAAPGSKTTHMAMLMENQGEIHAYDIYEHKLELIREALDRLDIKNVKLFCQDATTLKDTLEHESYDKILLDGPCSGLGVMRRKPEIRYNDSSVLDEVAKIQEKLLENGYYLLKKGGKMVYSTCTLNKKENEKMVASFIARHPDCQIEYQRTILPFEYQSDGFYICKITKE